LENWLANLKTIFAGETEANLTKFFQTNAERIYRV
jgi:predicted TIM-barrel fold metal-dependent hydrolase